VALRNQLLAILRDAEQPLTTQQVAAGRVTGIAAAVYPQLCVLHRLGHIAREHYPNPDSIAQATAQKRLSQHLAEADSRSAYWHYSTQTPITLNALLDAVQDA
jgi:glutathione S-transferase